MKLMDCINDYGACILHEQGVTRETQDTYMTWLRHFRRRLETNSYPEPTTEHFNAVTLRRFLYAVSAPGYRRPAPYRPRTIRSIFHPIRALGAFLVSNKLLTENPAMSIGMPKKDAATRLTVSD
jgi:site-specific recombinase XerD